MRSDIFRMLLSLPTQPRLHGNGMIQWYVNSNQRLHIHLPALKFEGHNATIHDHTFDMDSTILGGKLNHQIWHVEQNGTETHDVIQFEPDVRKSAKGHVAWSGELKMLHAMNFSAGDQYWQKAGTFHSSTGLGEAVTLITKRSTGKQGMARIVCPAGATPTDAFDPERTPDMATLLNHIADATIETPELENTLIRAIRRDQNG